MDPSLDNCNIGELDNSEQVLFGNANSQMDVKSDQTTSEFLDEQIQKPIKQTTQELLKQFNDGLNNFLQESSNITENIINNDFNNPFTNPHQIIEKEFENDFIIKNNSEQQNLQFENFDDSFAGVGSGGIDCTDDNAMQITENSEATTNLLDEHSTLSNSKDTLSENIFDNRLQETNVDDDVKSTPMLSPNSEEVPPCEENATIEEKNYLQLNGNELQHDDELNGDDKNFIESNSNDKEIFNEIADNYDEKYTEETKHSGVEILEDGDIIQEQSYFDNKHMTSNELVDPEFIHEDIEIKFDGHKLESENLEPEEIQLGELGDVDHLEKNIQQEVYRENEEYKIEIEMKQDLEIPEKIINEFPHNELENNDKFDLVEHEIIENFEPMEVDKNLELNGTDSHILDNQNELQNFEQCDIDKITTVLDELKVSNEEIYSPELNDDQQLNEKFDVNEVSEIPKELTEIPDFRPPFPIEIDEKSLETEMKIEENLEPEIRMMEPENLNHDDPIKHDLDQSQEIVQQDQHQLNECDDDEFNYMRLKEGQGEKQQKLEEQSNDKENIQPESNKIEETLLTVSNQEQETLNIGAGEADSLIPSSAEKSDLNLNIEIDMNYQLNPEAKEFVPNSPPLTKLNGATAPKFPNPELLSDDLVAQSPRKNNALNMDEILIPDEAQFDNEVEKRPHEFDDQKLNLKEAKHAPEKDAASPTNDEFLMESTHSILDVHKSESELEVLDFHPVAELENANMKDSIYIEKFSAENQVAEQFEMEKVEELLNSVQPLPDLMMNGGVSTLNENVESVQEENFSTNKNLDNSNTKDKVCEKKLDIPETDDQIFVSEVKNKLHLIPEDLNTNSDLSLSSDTRDLHNLLQSPEIGEIKNESILTKEKNNEDKIKREIATGVAVTAVVITAATAAVVATEDEKTKSKVAEKNLKNKLDSAAKSLKVSDTKKIAANKSATSPKPISPAVKKSPLDKPRTMSPEKSKFGNKPKTLSVASAQAPVTLTFQRPRTAPAKFATPLSGSEKKPTTNADKKVIEKKPLPTSSIRSKIDPKTPATLVFKKTTTLKPETKTVAPSNAKPTQSKTSFAPRTTPASKVTTSATETKPRPASAAASAFTSRAFPPKPTPSTYRTILQTKTTSSIKPASLSKASTLKSPIKPPTTKTAATARSPGTNTLRPSSGNITTTTTTKTAPTRPLAGTVRKLTTTTTTRTQSNSLTSPNAKKTLNSNIKSNKPEPNQTKTTETITNTTIKTSEEVPIEETENLINADANSTVQPKVNGTHTDDIMAV